jgi:hypothetical protein
MRLREKVHQCEHLSYFYFFDFFFDNSCFKFKRMRNVWKHWFLSKQTKDSIWRVYIIQSFRCLRAESFSERFYMNGPRFHQNPWNLAIWFIIQYYKIRIFLFAPKKFFVNLVIFLKNLVLSKKKKSVHHVIDCKLCIFSPILMIRHFFWR